ncbi:hypothetical protein [Mycobacteroides abscessus]|uniref:hypothetical protein n=1 Tax=Mycobacteroides abscessus TaxID=36809 RepID=UPI0005E7DE2F|nr:hypothetical protein [Mycobacteroides abscessus]CPR69544.1 Uncharacterised protein [Mycobacteroides abscessus]CPU70613.1 Uncharacterised protein [Mycobacteroides abscessus]
MAISMNADSADDLAAFLRRLQSGEGDGGTTTTADPAADTKTDPKADPKTEPKPTAATTTGTTPDADPKPTTDAKPAADTKAADTKPKANPKRFSPKVGKTLTNLGVPPSAIRNLKTAPVKGLAGIAKGQWNAGQHWAGKGAEKLGSKLAAKGLQGAGKTALKSAAKFIPGLGSAIAAYSAFQNFKSGDYVGGVLNLIGVIPGPIGWIALGASAIWEMSGLGDRYEEWQAPDGVDTHMLMRDAKDVANVKEIDAALREAQANVFSFQDGPTGSVWDASPPKALELNTPEVVAAATDWLNGITKLFAEIDKTLMNSGEQYFTEQRASLAQHFTAMAALSGQVKQLTDQLAAADKGGETAYRAVTHANAAARGQLANSGKLDDSGPATTMETELQKGRSAITAANTKIEALWSDAPVAVVAVRDLAAGGTKPTTERPQEAKPVATTPTPTVTPTAQTPAAATPARTETPTKNNDDLSKLLSQLGNKAQTPTSSSPLGTGSGLGGGSPLGSQGLGGGQGGGTPLSSSKPDTSEKSEPKKLDDRKPGERKTEEPKKLGDEKSLSTPKPEQAKAAVPKPEEKPAAVPAAAVPAPGAAAPTPAQQNAAHAAQAQEPSKEVDVKGQKTLFPDAKTAKLAELLAKADPTHPVSLADAAKAAGLTPPVPGQDPGRQINPAEAKPGDIMVASDKQYMLLGDGKFYDLQDYKIVGAAELPQNMGDRAGYFHLNDPNPGTPAPGQGGQPGAPGAPVAPAPAQPGPVSGQTGGVQNAVPNATAASVGPTDGNAPGGQQPAAGAPAAPGGVPSVGAPGVPKPGGAGPTNAASTATGTGQGGVSSGGQALDPGAVR